MFGYQLPPFIFGRLTVRYICCIQYAGPADVDLGVHELQLGKRWKTPVKIMSVRWSMLLK